MYAQTNDTVSNIAIVGGGFTGACAAIRLMRHARGKMNIYLFEKGGIGGIAYSKTSADQGHHLNLQAGRIPMFREDPEHFIRWARMNGHDLDKTSPVPRRLFGEYCEDMMRSEAKKCPLVNLHICNGDTVGFDEESDGISIGFKQTPTLKNVKEGESNHIALPEKFDQLVLATGHLEVKKPEALKHIDTNGNGVIIDQYRPDAYEIMDEAVDKLSKRDTILIMGSGLAALDPVVSIVERCERLGKALPHFILCSRSAHQHPTYSEDHEHRAFEVKRPAILDQEKITLAELEMALMGPEGIWKKTTDEIRAKAGKEILDNERLVHERTMKAMEPHVAELISKMSSEDVQEAFKRHGSLITSHRIGIVPKIGRLIDSLVKSKHLEFMRGDLESFAEGKAVIIEPPKESIVPFKDKNIRKPAKGGETFEPVLLINSIGRNYDYTDTKNEFWNNVDFAPNEKIGKGVKLTEDSRLFRKDGKTPYERVWVAGVPAIGDEIERYGRLGAFNQSLGPAKTRATQVAHMINQQISRPIDAVNDYFDFVKARKGGLVEFLAQEKGAPLSEECKKALASLVRLFKGRLGSMAEHIYADTKPHDHAQSPSKALEHLERSAHDTLAMIPELAKDCNISHEDECHLLKLVPHILLEEHINDAMRRCCDITKDPSNIARSVMGMAV